MNVILKSLQCFWDWKMEKIEDWGDCNYTTQFNYFQTWTSRKYEPPICDFISTLHNGLIVLPSALKKSQIASFMGPTWDPPGSCRPQVVPTCPHEPCYQGYHKNCQDFAGYFDWHHLVNKKLFKITVTWKNKIKLLNIGRHSNYHVLSPIFDGTALNESDS